MAIEIVDLPIKNGDFPEFFVCLPEGSPIPDCCWKNTLTIHISEMPIQSPKHHIWVIIKSHCGGPVGLPAITSPIYPQSSPRTSSIHAF